MLNPSLINVLIDASRPAGWIFGPILFGVGFLQSGYTPKTVSKTLLIFLQMLTFSFPLCIIVFGINDVYDYHNDVNNPRKLKAGLEGGVLIPIYHPLIQNAAYLSTLFILLISLLSQNLRNVLTTAILLGIGWQYSAPPFRLKEVPFLDSISNGLIVLSAWCAGYSYRERDFGILLSKGLILALCSSGLHALGAAVDYEWDMKAGQTTIATYSSPAIACSFSFLTFVIGWYLERRGNRIIKLYLQIGSLMVAMSCLCPQWTHYLFRSAVSWSILMVLLWFVSKLGSRTLF